MSFPHYCVSAFYSEDLLYNRCRVYYQAGFSTHKHNTYKFTLAPCTTQDTGLPCTLRGVSYGALNHVRFRAAMHLTWCMVNGALNYVEFRAAMHPTSCMAEREGFEPSIPLLAGYTISNRAPSASRASLHFKRYAYSAKRLAFFI